VELRRENAPTALVDLCVSLLSWLLLCVFVELGLSELHMVCLYSVQFAIDYTQSNDYQKSGPKSLHRLPEGSRQRAMDAVALLTSADGNDIDVTDEGVLSGLNDYQKVILSVGSIIEEYDTDKNLTVIGFCAKNNSTRNQRPDC
jgi:hypothetical protein